MKQIILMALLAAMPAAPVLGGPAASASKESALASQDPLMRQILHRQLTQRNGGITAAVRIASGQSIELQMPELDLKLSGDLKDALNSNPSEDALSGLKPEAGLAARDDKGAPAQETAVKPTAQLKVIAKSRKDWGEGRKAAAKAMEDGSELVSVD
ncbi:MAG: hypothetical protein HY926_02720 [Elusimicrobia bacterium]|nr:hypothetical protein [Elusimicrobiota bacterium]